MSSTSLLGGRYRLVERLGGGGMSVVWRGYDEVLGRSVAVKLLTASYAADIASRARIRAEGQIAARLAHPHICRVYDYGESLTESGDRVPFLVMELLSGTTLADQLRAGPLPARAALRLSAQVASALAAAHRAGLVHRDIKPGNIMLTPSGPKVVDFGIAAAAGEAAEPREDGEVWGTPAYVAPERLTGGEVVPASDVYALGLMLYRMLTGTAPWQVETVTDVLSAHAYQEPAPLPEIDGLPEEVADLCHRCLAKDPAQRPPAAEVAEQLAEAGGWRLSALTDGVLLDGVLVDGDDQSMLPPAARKPGDRAQFAQAVLGGGPAGNRRWPERSRPSAEIRPRPTAGIRPAAPAGPARPGRPARSATVTGGAGSPPGSGGAVRRRFALRHSHRRWAAFTAASLVAVLTAVFGGLWIPGGSANRYLGFEVAAAPPGAGLGPSSITGPPTDAAGQGAEDRRQGPSVAPSAMAGGGGGEAPADPLAPGGSGDTGSDSGAGPGSSGGSSSGSAPGSGSSGGSGTSPGSPPQPPPPPPPPPPPSPVDPPPPPPSPTPERIVGSVTDPLIGTLQVACVGATATLESWSLVAGLSLGSVDDGPAAVVGITVLDLLGIELGLSARCVDGAPAPA